jgi:hypothetical protein
MGLINDRFEGVYASINAEGIISVKVDEGTRGAKFKEYELRDGTKGSKWVLEYNKLDGFITDIKFFDGNFGEQINITIKDESGEIILTMPLGSNYASDIMKKLPNVNFSNKVIFSPYSFEDDKKKRKRGVTIYQNGEKIQSFFSDSEGKTTNGFPVPAKESDKMKTKDWTVYFIEVGEFLKSYIESEVIDKIKGAEVFNTELLNSKDELSVEDIPFNSPDEIFDTPETK